MQSANGGLLQESMVTLKGYTAWHLMHMRLVISSDHCMEAN